MFYFAPLWFRTGERTGRSAPEVGLLAGPGRISRSHVTVTQSTGVIHVKYPVRRISDKLQFASFLALSCSMSEIVTSTGERKRRDRVMFFYGMEDKSELSETK